MRTTIVCATFLSFGAGMAGVGALNNVALIGSDTMEKIVLDVLAQCPHAMANGITFRGGGSSSGGNAMTGNNPSMTVSQNVAPMTRRLSQAEGCSTALGAIPATEVGQHAEGLVIGLDAVVVAAGARHAEACGGGLAFTSARSFTVTDLDGDGAVECGDGACPGNVYTIADWRDALALIYGGRHNNHPTSGQSKNCDSDARRALVARWQNLFEGDTCQTGACDDPVNGRRGLRRAYRGSDLSATTDVFAALIGLASIPLPANVAGSARGVIDFCNAYSNPPVARFGGDADLLDLDPIRITCDGNEEVCSPVGVPNTRGLVTATFIPSNHSPEQLYYLSNGQPRICDTGVFRLMPPLINGLIPSGFLCPNGRGTFFSKCWQPVILPAGGGIPEADCIARPFPAPGFSARNITHSGVFNTMLKTREGYYRRDQFNRLPVYDTATRESLGGYSYLVHATRVIAPGAAPCRHSNEIDQIGCLTQANPCTIGLTGRGGIVPPGVVALAVGGVAPSPGGVEALVRTPDPTDDYPLTRRLHFNTIKGFTSPDLLQGEWELARCMANDALVGPVVAARGFIRVPTDGGLQGVFCEDFDETRPTAAGGCGAAAPNVDACADNTGLHP